MYSSRMYTAHSLLYRGVYVKEGLCPGEVSIQRVSGQGRGGSLSRGGLCQGDPVEGTWDQRQRLSGRNMEPETETLPEGTWDQAAKTGSDIIQRPPLNRMTHRCKNITLRAIISSKSRAKLWNEHESSKALTTAHCSGIYFLF